jgi:hypothetical protein
MVLVCQTAAEISRFCFPGRLGSVLRYYMTETSLILHTLVLDSWIQLSCPRTEVDFRGCILSEHVKFAKGYR